MPAFRASTPVLRSAKLGSMTYDPQRRQALFTLADARGNNPHGTREDAVREGQRLNAQRYETIEQMNAKLDARAQPVAPALGQAQPVTAGQMLGWAIGLGLLGALAFLAVSKPAPKLNPEPEPAPNPPPQPPVTTSTVVVNPPLALPAPSTVVVNPAPPPQIIDVQATPVKAKRRRRAKKVEAATVNVTVEPSEPKA